MPKTIHQNFPLPDQKQAEATMKAHGVKSPRLCQCEKPALEYDEDGCLWCWKCARRRRA